MTEVLTFTAWDPDDTGEDGGRVYSADSPRDAAEKHAEWMYMQGDYHNSFSVSVRAGTVNTFTFYVEVRGEVTFHATETGVES